MPRPKNASQGKRFEVTLSGQSVELLQALAQRGIYGRTPAEVGGRFIERALADFVEAPRFSDAILTKKTRTSKKRPA